jgi:3-phenylpropionate/cinnamic acid dioxygenase small subunit
MKLTGYQTPQVDARETRELRMQVEEFNTEYCAVLDAGEIEQWPQFFVDDCVYRVTGRENADANLPVGLVYCEGVGMLHDRAVAINRTQMFAPRCMLHVCGNVRVLSAESSEGFTAQTNFMLLQTLVEGPTTIHLAGRYYDRFVRVDGKLKLKERQVVYDTTVIATDVVYPV